MAKIERRVYECSKCKYREIHKTNHRGETYSWVRYHTCPKCPPHAKYPQFGGSTTWEYVRDANKGEFDRDLDQTKYEREDRW